MANGELDFSSLWSWTIPLWGLFVLVVFLGGVIADPPTLLAAPLPTQAGGGGGRSKTVRRQ
jgi:hypothetical protein